MYQEVEPPEELQDAVRCLWYTSLEFDRFPSGFDIVPDGYAELIFHFGSGCSISTSAGLRPLPSPFLMGLLDQPAVLHAKNRLEIIGVRCFPWTVFDLLGLSSGKDSIRTVEHPIAQLQAPLDTLVQAGKLAEALALVSQYFQSAQTGVTTNSMLVRAGGAMRKANGTLPVSQVASAAHATVRTLERKFKQSSGRTVKDVSGLMRFEQVRNHLWLDPEANLAGLAHELGYTDQAHLSREFKRYSGTTPAAFARKTKNGTYRISDDIVAFIQA